MNQEENVGSALMRASEGEVGMLPSSSGGSQLSNMMKTGGSKLEYSTFGGRSRKRRNSKKSKKSKKSSKSKKNRKSKK